jgi:uncharacterized protein YbaP (TraB family)
MRRFLKTTSFFILVMLTWPGMCLAEDDSALYWAISRDGQSVGFLLGTIHSEDPRVLDFPDSFISELSGNEVFAMEMVPDLPTLTRLTEYMHYQDGTTLESVIGSERFNRLLMALKSYQVPQDWIRKMKVWAAMMTLSVPPPESGFFMDFSLSLRAAGAGLKVMGLETLEDQLSFLEEMPMEQQLQLLDEALESYHRVEEIHDQMVEDYLSGDVQALRRQAEQQLDLLEPGTRQYFMEQGIDARNGRMLESLLLQLEDKRVFVAVGALHLPGEKGIVELLRQSGFSLTPLPLPLLPPE